MCSKVTLNTGAVALLKLIRKDIIAPRSSSFAKQVRERGIQNTSIIIFSIYKSQCKKRLPRVI